MIKTEFMELYEKLSLLEGDEKDTLEKRRDELRAELNVLQIEQRKLSLKKSHAVVPDNPQMTPEESARLVELNGKLPAMYKELRGLDDRLYAIKSLTDGVADEEDWERAIENVWPGELEYDDLEVEVEGEFGGGEVHDRLPYGAPISYYPETTLTGTMSNCTYSLDDVSNDEAAEKLAKFLGKEVKEVLRSDLATLKAEEVYDFLCDEYRDEAAEQLADAAESGDFDYDDVSWNDPDDYEPSWEDED